MKHHVLYSSWLGGLHFRIYLISSILLFSLLMHWSIWSTLCIYTFLDSLTEFSDEVLIFFMTLDGALYIVVEKFHCICKTYYKIYIEGFQQLTNFYRYPKIVH